MTAPALSVVVYLPSGTEYTARLTMDTLCAQTACHRLEVLVIGDSAMQAIRHGGTAALHAIRAIHIGNVESAAEAFAVGVREASAPLIAFAGNHSYPEPEWAARLIDAHEGPWAGVGPSEVNANPATSVSWAHFLIGHGRWFFPVDRGPVELLPMRNAAFKRALLLQYGSALHGALERDGDLAQSLRRQGLLLLLAPEARIHHFNVSRLTSFVRFRFAVGRAYAASRAARERWGTVRRLMYACGWPLIPFMHLRRIAGWIGRCEGHAPVWRVLTALLLGLAATASGEAVGYIAGIGAARRQILTFESDLGRHMTRKDREKRAAGFLFGAESA